MSQNNGKARREQRRAGAAERANSHVCGPTCKKNRSK